MRWPRVRLTVRMTMVLVLILGVGLGWAARQARLQREALALEEAKLRGNSAVAEVWHNGRLALVEANAATPDDTIRSIVDIMAKEGIDGSSVRRFYSEQQPSSEWCQYFKEHWPKAVVKWSSGPGEDLDMKSALDHR